jgi:hypothetical protein
VRGTCSWDRYNRSMGDVRGALNERQLAVLRWIRDGCPAGVMTGYTYKTTALALQGRRMAVVISAAESGLPRLPSPGCTTCFMVAFLIARTRLGHQIVANAQVPDGRSLRHRRTRLRGRGPRHLNRTRR